MRCFSSPVVVNLDLCIFEAALFLYIVNDKFKKCFCRHTATISSADNYFHSWQKPKPASSTMFFPCISSSFKLRWPHDALLKPIPEVYLLAMMMMIFVPAMK